MANGTRRNMTDTAAASVQPVSTSPEEEAGKEEKKVDGGDGKETENGGETEPAAAKPEPQEDTQKPVEDDDDEEEDLFGGDDDEPTVPERDATAAAAPDDTKTEAKGEAPKQAPFPSPAKEPTIASTITPSSIPRKSSSKTVTSTTLTSPPSVPRPIAATANQYGLPAGVKIPPSVTASLLHQGKLLDTLKSLPVTLINDALTEYDDAVQIKGGAIRNHGAYLFGVVKRYVSVTERAASGEGSGILPMGEELTPAVNDRLEKLVASNFCTRDEMNDKVRSKIRMLSEKDALFALDELASVDRATIRNFGSYFMGILNRYMRGDVSSKTRPQPSGGMSANRFDRDRGRDRFYRDNHMQQQQSYPPRDRSRDRYDDRSRPYGGRDNNTMMDRPPYDSRPWQNQQQQLPPPPPQQQSQQMGYSVNGPPQQNRPMNMPMSNYPPQQFMQQPPNQQQPLFQQQSNQPQQFVPQGFPPNNMGSGPQGMQQQGSAGMYQQPQQQQQPMMGGQQSNQYGMGGSQQPQQPFVQQQQQPGSMNFVGNQQQQPAIGGQPPRMQQPPPQQGSNVPGSYAPAPGGWQSQQQQQQQQLPVDILGLADKAASAVQALANQNKMEIPPPTSGAPSYSPPPPSYQPYGGAPAAGPITAPQQQQQQPGQQMSYPGQQQQQQIMPQMPYGNKSMGQQFGGPRRRRNASLNQLPVTVQYAVQNLQATGAVDGPLDEGILGMINDLPEPMALAALQKFATIDKNTMRNKTAYLAGLLRRELENVRR